MNTVFLNSELSDEERDSKTARFNVIPMPLERTVSYGSGTENGPAAILEASDQLERLCSGHEPCQAGIITQPAVDCSGPLPEVMQRLAIETGSSVEKGQIPVVLGGEHSLTYGAVMGVSRALGRPLGLIQIDAHADLRKAYQNEKHSHASVMQLIADEGVRLAQFGVRALCQEEVDRRIEKDVFFKDGEELVTERLHMVVLPEDFPNDIYVSFDVDGLDPSEMPATGTPVPGGLSFYQSLHLIKNALKGRNLVGFDVVELAPIEGQEGWDFTAAQIVYSIMAMVPPKN